MKTIVHGREPADDAQNKTRPCKKQNGLGKGFEFFWWVFVLVWFFFSAVFYTEVKFEEKGKKRGEGRFLFALLGLLVNNFFLCWINRAAWRSMLGEVRFLKACVRTLAVGGSFILLNSPIRFLESVCIMHFQTNVTTKRSYQAAMGSSSSSSLEPLVRHCPRWFNFRLHQGGVFDSSTLPS